MQVYVTQPPSGNPPALLTGRFSPLHGTFAVVIGPAEKMRTKRTRKSVSIPFFHALGKNLGLAGSYTSQTSEFRSYLADWFAAYDARELVIFNANVLYPATMQGLLEYASTVPHLTFVTEPGDFETTRQAVIAAGITPQHLDWDHLLTRLPQLPDPAVPAPPAYGMEHLPTTDFLMFRAHARSLNTAERFEAIDTDYRRAHQAATAVDPELDQVVAMLGVLSRDAVSTAQMMVALRATQAALLRRGWYLAAHQDKAIGTLSAIKPPAPTDADWLKLHGFVPTRRPATVALYLLDVPRSGLDRVTVAQARTWLDTDTVGTVPLPRLARPLLAAHLHRRTAQHATDDESFLNHPSATALADDLVQTRRHLDLPIDGRNIRGENSHSTRPLWRIGLELRSVA